VVNDVDGVCLSAIVKRQQQKMNTVEIILLLLLLYDEEAILCGYGWRGAMPLVGAVVKKLQAVL
jgi:hypothetical protein